MRLTFIALALGFAFVSCKGYKIVEKKPEVHSASKKAENSICYIVVGNPQRANSLNERLRDNLQRDFAYRHP